MVSVVSPGVGHVVQHVVPRPETYRSLFIARLFLCQKTSCLQSVSLSDRQQPFRSEGSLGVDVEALALGASHVDGQLAGDGQSVTQLAFACTELAKQLGDGTRLDAAIQELVQFFGT